jgi:hypothetical protein
MFANWHLSKNMCGWKEMLGLVGSLLLLHSAVAFAQPQPSVKKSLLGDKHKAAGVECLQCHQEKPGTLVATTICKGCHSEVEKAPKAKSGLPNPHDAHMPFPDCADCHHMHKASENQCDSCHSFGFKTP